MIQIAILGFGTVGGGVAEVLDGNRKQITDRCKEEINVKYILDLREFPNHPLGNRVVHSIDAILADDEVSVVVEAMGGAHPAYDFTKAAIEHGKSVVTSNKEVVATFGVELLKLAEAHGVSYLFEASVGGGIPIIRPMQVDLASNKILAVDGILNGTTNYILTQMKQGTSFDNALADAQKKGYAEANPAADVEGVDAARKIVILAALAFGVLASPEKISRKGITAITAEENRAAAAFGGAVKLICHAEEVGGKLLCAVAPHFVPASNPLCFVDDVNNGILLNCNMLGRTMFFGAGAGKLPTAGAVVADVIDVVTNAERTKKLPKWTPAAEGDYAAASVYAPGYCVGITGCPKCKAKAQKALGTDTVADFAEGKFALLTDKMTEKEVLEKLTGVGLEADFLLPIAR